MSQDTKVSGARKSTWISDQPLSRWVEGDPRSVYETLRAGREKAQNAAGQASSAAVAAPVFGNHRGVVASIPAVAKIVVPACAIAIALIATHIHVF